MKTIDLSIIIVNYNVKFFLEQCIRSVLSATVDIAAEIIVVDNNSTDGSQDMLKQTFPDVHLIENTDNPGFSKANNQAIKIARGTYVLLLNPDTVVGEDTFTTCLDFMETHPDAGSLGVYMLDGNGVFLPESKRALPTPWVSFYKIFGLSSLFPNNKKFGQYHLTYLNKNRNHPVDILSGAYMFMRKSALDKVGLLDETFFMYGEDIDLSYRFLRAGYQNYYLADTKIIHYKGESTKKGSLNYVKVFYQAMLIFADKHFRGRLKVGFTFAIRVAVYLRAFLAIFSRLLVQWGFPLLEWIMIYMVMYGIKSYWEHYVKYIEGQGGQYPLIYETVYLPVYATIFVFFLWLGGAYRKPYRLRPIFTAPIWAFISIATTTYVFSFIYNFSRAIVGLSSVFAMLIAFTNRGIINWRTHRNFFFTEVKHRRSLLVGTPDQLALHWSMIHHQLNYPLDMIGVVSSQDLPPQQLQNVHLGEWDQLEAIITLYQVEEVIFCNEGIPTSQILEQMVAFSDLEIDIKIIPPNSHFIIGPQQVFHPRIDFPRSFPLQAPHAKRTKRSLDVLCSSTLLLVFPILGWRFQHPLRAIRELWMVLIGRKHLVGYLEPVDTQLPPLKPGLINLSYRLKNTDRKALHDNPLVNLFYASNYTWELDLELFLKGWRNIGT